MMPPIPFHEALGSLFLFMSESDIILALALDFFKQNCRQIKHDLSVFRRSDKFDGNKYTALL